MQPWRWIPFPKIFKLLKAFISEQRFEKMSAIGKKKKKTFLLISRSNHFAFFKSFFFSLKKDFFSNDFSFSFNHGLELRFT